MKGRTRFDTATTSHAIAMIPAISIKLISDRSLNILVDSSVCCCVALRAIRAASAAARAADSTAVATVSPVCCPSAMVQSLPTGNPADTSALRTTGYPAAVQA